MGLWKVKIDNQPSKIIYNNGSLSLSNVSNVQARKFKYKVEQDSPTSVGLVTLKDKKYITPHWIECHFETTLDDLDIISNIKKIGKEIFKVRSSSSNKTYKVIKKGDKYTCNCWGYQRLKNKEQGCKHIKQVKNK